MTLPTPTSILLVEDDETARIVTQATLQRAGFAVTAAPDGETALRIMNEQQFAVIVSDIRMRVVDGLAVLENARQQPYRPAVVLLTGFASVESAVEALRKGAYDYLLKPCHPTDLVDCVNRAVQHQADQLNQLGAFQAIIDIASRAQDVPPAAANEPAAPPEVPRTVPPVAAPASAEEPGRYLRVGDLSIDYFRHRVTFAAQPVRVTQIEYELLRCLAEAHGRVLSYREIARHTHNQDMDDNDARLLLKQHVRNVRGKIDASYLVNIRSTGYMLVDPAEAEADIAPSEIEPDE